MRLPIIAAESRKLLCLIMMTSFSTVRAAETDPRADALSPDVWRRERRIVDMHMHIEGLPTRFVRAINIMNAAGIGLGVELGSGTVIPGKEGVSEFEKVQQVGKDICP